MAKRIRYQVSVQKRGFLVECKARGKDEKRSVLPVREHFQPTKQRRNRAKRPFPDGHYRRSWPAFGLFLLLLGLLPPRAGAAASPLAALPQPPTGFEIISDVAERCTVGVVNISSTRTVTTRDNDLSPFFSDPLFQHFFGDDFPGAPQQQMEQSLGSGVIVSPDGLVLTSSHVVEGAEEIVVTLADQRQLKAKIVGADPRSDVAVIRLLDAPKDLHPIPLGDSSRLRLGEVVLAIGNPFGLSHTVTMGIVSALGRANVGIVDYEDFIQTDAAINPGNSGGALVDLHGQLIGINTAILSRSGGYQGIGFAIPTNLARAIMANLIKSGRVVRGWMGVTVQDLDPSLARALGVKESGGVLISDVAPGSSGGAAGLKRGEVIRKFNGEAVTSAARFRQDVAAFGAGNRVELEVEDRAGTRKVPVLLTPMPAPPPGSEVTLPNDDGPLGGLTIAPLSDLNRQKYNLPVELKKGVVIAGLKSGSPVADTGLKDGDVLLELNRREIAEPTGFAKLYHRLSRRELLLLAYRDGSTFYLVLQP